MTGLRSRAEAGRLSVPLTGLAASFLHMHANRILRSAHRAQELVLYDREIKLYEATHETAAEAAENSPKLRECSAE
jgi:hypothetical protein